MEFLDYYDDRNKRIRNIGKNEIHEERIMS